MAKGLCCKMRIPSSKDCSTGNLTTGIIYVWQGRRPLKIARLGMASHPLRLFLEEGPEPGHVQQRRRRNVSATLPNKIGYTCVFSVIVSVATNYTHTLDKGKHDESFKELRGDLECDVFYLVRHQLDEMADC